MPKKFDATIRAAVVDAINKQAAAGVDIVSDGEMGKISYATYIRHRLTGFEPGQVPRATPQDLDDYPAYRDKIAASGATPKYHPADLQRPDQGEEPGAAASGHRAVQGCAVEGEGDGPVS